MAKTAAERQRERRARIWQNPITYQEYKLKERNRKAEARKMMTDKDLKLYRWNVRNNTRKWKEKLQKY